MREIIVIESNQSKQVRKLLNQAHINYKIYQEPEQHQKGDVFSDYKLALQDREREQEADDLENAEEEDIINEEW